ncbi:hypothetical protein [Clostridium sp. DJ247]|uniref:hypothetical protein n=1 Tax=Clostridium sp. DJ247 TaxID=2726188 RepID=UPI0016280452|nr:hypothetical protein [Clostridium sp. DJ247]MBC2579971.1 hypothetical protein [Clostridium sp. DJ247]
MKNLLKEVKGNIYGLGCYCFKYGDTVAYVGSGMMNDRLQSHLYALKRGLYEGTNKDILQRKYNLGELSFEVLHFSENNSTYLNGTDEERKAIQESLEVLEQFYHDMYKDTVCNKMSKIKKWSTSPNIESTNKRKKANTGIKNPMAKYREEHICNVLYLKQYGFKNKEINKIMKIECGVDINTNYIYSVGNTKWVHIKGKYENWMDKYINKNIESEKSANNSDPSDTAISQND